MRYFLEIFPRLLLSVLLLAAISGGFSAQAFDQLPPPNLDGPPPFDGPGDGLGNEEDKNPVTIHAVLTPPEAKRPAYLCVTVDLLPGWHIYSTTQTGDGPIPTKIKTKSNSSIKSVGTGFVSPAPKRVMDPGFGIEVERHYDTVTWFMPLELSPGADLKTLVIDGSVYAQACNDKIGCRPPSTYPFQAKLVTDPKKLSSLVGIIAKNATSESNKNVPAPIRVIQDTPGEKTETVVYNTETLYNSVHKPFGGNPERKVLVNIVGKLSADARQVFDKVKGVGKDSTNTYVEAIEVDGNKFAFQYENTGVRGLTDSAKRRLPLGARFMAENGPLTHLYLVLPKGASLKEMQQAIVRQDGKGRALLEVVPTEKTRLYEIATRLNQALDAKDKTEGGEKDVAQALADIVSGWAPEDRNEYEVLTRKLAGKVGGPFGEMSYDGARLVLDKQEKKRQAEIRKKYGEDCFIMRLPFYQRAKELMPNGVITGRAFYFDVDTSGMGKKGKAFIVIPKLTFSSNLQKADLSTNLENLVYDFELVRKNPSSSARITPTSVKAVSEGTYMGKTQYAKYAIDGKHDTGWASQWSMPAWLEIDLGKTQRIGKVKVLWGMGSHNQYFTIESSRNKQSWKTVVASRWSDTDATNYSGRDKGNYHGNSKATWETFTFSPLDARYVRIHITKTQAPSSHIFQAIVHELEVFSSE